MPANESTAERPRRTSKQGRGRRRAGIGLLVFGVAVLVAAFVPSTASAQATSFLPSVTSTTTYTCVGNDADDGGTTTAVLTGIGLNPVVLSADITNDPVDSPNDGDTFTMTFHWRFTLPQSLTNIAVMNGTANLQQGPASLPVHVDSGATGPDVVGSPTPGQVIDLGDGSVPIIFDVPPPAGFSGDFVRDGAIGTPIQFSPGTVTLHSTGNDGTGIPLSLICSPSASPLVLTDQQGETPPPTTQAPPPTPPPATSAPATTAAPGSGVEATSATSGSGLARTGFHAELLYIGIAMLGAGYALSLTGRRVAKASARRSD